MAVNAYQKYRDNSVFTASPEELTLMLYNGLVKFIGISISAINEQNLEKANENIIRAQDIINEFRQTLNESIEVSKSLDLLYDYMYRRLLDANIHKDAEILDEVLNLARELRDTWAQAIKIAKKGK